MKEENKLSRFIEDMRRFKNQEENIAKDGTELFDKFKVFKKISEQFGRYDRAEAVRKAILEFNPHFDSVHLEGVLGELDISESQWKSIYESLEQSRNHSISIEETDSSTGSDNDDDNNSAPTSPSPIPVPVP